jgi:hypothetical protein
MRAEKHNLFEDQILQEVKGWVKELVYMISTTTKFFKLVETYWIVKKIISQSLENKRGEKGNPPHNL